MKGKVLDMTGVVYIGSGLGTDDSAKFSHQERLAGVRYGPFRDNQSFERGVFPTTDKIQADLELTAQLTQALRMFSGAQTLKRIPDDSMGLDVYPHVWMTTTEQNRGGRTIDIDDMVFEMNHSGCCCQ